MKNILLTHKIKINKDNKLFYEIEKNWFTYFKNKNINLVMLDTKKKINEELKKKKISAIILHGGNDLPQITKTKNNLLRKKNESIIFNYALRKKIPILAICYGFQFVADFYGVKIKSIKNHVKKNHSLIFKKDNLIKTIKVNSFHNYAIYDLPKFFNQIIRCKDGSIEFARSASKKILCMMFHPERTNSNMSFIKEIVFNHLKILK